MGSLSRAERIRALQTLGLWCQRELTGTEPPEEYLKALGFGSIEAMRIQLGNWGIPEFITQGEPVAERPKTPKSAPPPRKGRSSGPVTELPPAKAAAPLFREKLEDLTRATEDLEYRKEKRQGKRFILSSIYRDPVYVSRNLVSDEQWQYIREVFDLDENATERMHFGGASFILGEGTPAPESPLPELIAAYLLAGGAPRG